MRQMKLCEFCEFVDRSPGFTELIAEHPRDMFQVMINSLSDSEWLVSRTKTAMNLYLNMVLVHLVGLPENRNWDAMLFDIAKYHWMFQKAMDNPLPFIVTIVE